MSQEDTHHTVGSWASIKVGLAEIAILPLLLIPLGMFFVLILMPGGKTFFLALLAIELGYLVVYLLKKFASKSKKLLFVLGNIIGSLAIIYLMAMSGLDFWAIICPGIVFFALAFVWAKVEQRA